VRAATVNHTDCLFRSGASAVRAALGDRPPPFILGYELAGTVHIADEVGAFPVGQQVMGLVPPLRPEGGAQAELVSVPTASMTAVPAGMELTEATMLPMNALTALTAIDLLGLAPGQTVLVTGAAGVVGGLAMQYAKSIGLAVVGDASPADAPVVGRLGADLVVPRGPGMTVAVAAEFPDGVDGLVDAAVLGEAIYDTVRDGGAVAALRANEETVGGRVQVHQVAVSQRVRDTHMLDLISALAAAGTLTPRVAQVYLMERVREAHERLEQGGVRGKLVLQLDELEVR
jgi:NADPH:quinone reductase